MEGHIKVSPDKLASVAGEFGGQASQLKGLTGEMMNLIESLSAAWNGDASQTYLTKFRGLQSDMDKMFRMVSEHSTDLQEMSGAYKIAEAKNVEIAQALENNILV